MKKNSFRLAAVCAFVFFQTFSSTCAGNMENVPASKEEVSSTSEGLRELTLSLRIPSSGEVKQVPLFSEQFSQTPVAMVNGEPITLKEFAGQIVEMHGEVDQAGARAREDYSALLDRLITVKLGVQEAVNIGFDQTPALRKQMEDYALKTLITRLIGRELQGITPDQEKVEEIYRQMALEVKLATYKFRNQTDAQSLLDQYRAGGDFRQLVQEMVASGKTEGGGDEDYVKLKELLPNVAQAVFTLEIGAVSEIFQAGKEYLVFKLEDRRSYEDPEALTQAEQMVLEQQAHKRQKEYLESLEDKYVTIDKEAEESLDFQKIVTESPGIKAAEVFAKLRTDQRPLATITTAGGEPAGVITVAAIARELEASFYHGTDKPLVPQEIESSLDVILQDKLIRIFGPLEAKRLGIDKSEEYLKAVDRYREKVLFETFVSKVVLPGVKINPEDVQEYYQQNLAAYSTPLMLKMKSLAFVDEKNARDALKKLRAGSDFRWVSANVVGLAADDDVRMLNFRDSLLALTALPEEFQKIAGNASQGDIFLYEDPGKLFYVLLVDSAFPPEAKSFDEVKTEAANVVYRRKIKEALDEYVDKLKETYETEVFIVQD